MAAATIRPAVTFAELLLAKEEGLQILAYGFGTTGDGDAPDDHIAGLDSAFYKRVAGSRSGHAGNMFGRGLDGDDVAANAAFDPSPNDPAILTLPDITRVDRAASTEAVRHLATVTQTDAASDSGTKAAAGAAKATDTEGTASLPSKGGLSTLNAVLYLLLVIAVLALSGLAGRRIMLRRVKTLNYTELPSRLLSGRRR